MRSPEWSDEDRGWALALLAEEAALCAGGCGYPAEMSHDPNTARQWRVHTTVCQACLVRQAQAESDSKDGQTRGRLYGVEHTGG